MTLPTFTPPRDPQLGGEKTIDFRLLQADFGDGYEQVASDGINAIREKWRLVWNAVPDQEADTIETFVRQVGAWGAFYYKVPGTAATKKWRIESFTRTQSNIEYDAISLSIREIFDFIS